MQIGPREAQIRDEMVFSRPAALAGLTGGIHRNRFGPVPLLRSSCNLDLDLSQLRIFGAKHSRNRNFHRTVQAPLALTPRFIERYSLRGCIRNHSLRVCQLMTRSALTHAPLLVSPTLLSRLMRLYDYPHPTHPGRIIRGYDRPHAVRTARMCAAVAAALGHGAERVCQYQIACLLHDLGRAGLDRRLFGKIWSWAKAQGIPTRPREWRAVHPETVYGREPKPFSSTTATI
jgi:hypothetical protein